MWQKVKHNRGEQGQAVIIAILLFSVGSFIFIGGMTSAAFGDIREVTTLTRSKQSFYLSEGSLEDVVYRIKNTYSVASVETLTIGSHTATTTVTDISGGKILTALGDASELIRTSEVKIIEGTGASFFYGMQSDVGGVYMENSSSVIGNLYSNGTVTGDNSNLVRGDIVSAGPSGLVRGVHATGTVYAHTIDDSEVDKDAYYQVITDTTVTGTMYPGSSDQPVKSLPIADELIEQWKSDAEAGGVISSPCPYTINTSTTLGPVKITCNVVVDKNGTVLTLQGSVWVVGNITTKSGPTIRVDASLGSKSVPFIADNPSNRTTSSKVILENDTVFQGSGEPRSYVLLVSQNNSAELGGSEVAIDVKNSASGALLVYASHGEILLQNNIGLKEVTAYKIHTKNSAQVVYETGLASLIFTSGPGGGFEIESWREVE